MTPTLRLTPLSREECIALLKKKGKFLTNCDPSFPPVPLEEQAVRNAITLKLCSQTDDVIDVDDDDDQDGVEPEVVRYAVKYEDGSTAATTILGRQKGTGIKCVAISRALCDVSVAVRSSSLVATMRMRKPPNADHRRDGESSANKAKNNHYVHLDGELVEEPLGGEIPLANGSIIALYGATGFAYQVRVFRNDDGDDAAASADFVRSGPKRQKSNPAEEKPVEKKERRPTERERIRQLAFEGMVDEFSCAMCLDILVKSTFAFPCSHAFCNECSESITNAAAAAAAPSTFSTAADAVSISSPGGTIATTAASPKTKGRCPTCRGDVMEWMPARSYDTQVWSFALQGCFERSNAEYYIERRAQAGEAPPTEEERGSILNIGVGEGGNTTDKQKMVDSGPINLPPSVVSLLSNKQPKMTNLFRTLPKLNSSEMISNANNGMQVVKQAAYLPPLQYRAEPADNDVICID
jgi:hypothetical protein